jgi:O-6-methylguanine DNA methyltransferase
MPHETFLPRAGRVPAVLRDAQRQLEQYFQGRRHSFTVVLDETGAATDFQRDCWRALQRIPFGTVATYAEVARDVGRPRAARAVGNANHANPWPIVVPCHRVVATTGLGGYGGGVDVKAYLLGLEGYLDSANA